MRADKYVLPILREKLQTNEISREFIINFIKSGGLKIDQKKVFKPSHPLVGNEEIHFDIELLEKMLFPFSDVGSDDSSKLDIIFENDNLLVINKNAGVVMHPGAGVYSGTLIQMVFPDKKYSKDVSYRDLGVVHRLDKDTSGIVIISKNKQLTSYLASLFEKRMISKYYLAMSNISDMRSESIAIDDLLVCDNIFDKFSQLSREIDDSVFKGSGSKDSTTEGIFKLDKNCYLVNGFIFRKRRDSFRIVLNRSMVKSSAQPKFASLKLIPICRCENKIIFVIKLITGRTHQIRVTLKEIGFPIVNDPIYASKSTQVGQRMYLHSAMMKLKIPIKYLQADILSIKNENGEFESYLEIDSDNKSCDVGIRAYFPIK